MLPPPDSADAPVARGGSIGRYLVISLLGRGAMGSVYAAYDPELDRRVALKLLHIAEKAVGARERLLREARALAKLSHPNVVQIYDTGEHEGDVYLAMELVEGQTLEEYCHSTPPPRWEDVLAAYRDAAKGLTAAHEQGLVHRDVKPANILRGNDGRVRVADFGLVAGEAVPGTANAASSAAVTQPGLGPGAEDATVAAPLRTPPAPSGDSLDDTVAPSFGPTRSDEGVTMEGALLGTPLYMAPEQHRSSRVTPASDQYSLCASLYEGVYGAPPFPVDPAARGAETFVVLLNHKLQGLGPPPPGSKVPGWLHQVLARGLAPDPGARFPSMAELATVLSADRSAPRRGWQVALAVTVAVGILGTLAHLSEAGRDLCSGGAQRFDEVWSAALRDRAQAAFLATGLPYADHAWSAVAPLVASYGQEWVHQYTDTCEATRLRGEQSEDVLDLRMACLAQRLEEVRASVELFSTADRQVVEKSVALASGWPPPTDCADVEALKAPMRAPRDVATRQKVAELRARLAKAKALEAAGKYAEGLAAAEQALTAARALAYQPVTAEALNEVGRLQVAARLDAEAKLTLEEAFYTAEASRDDEIAARTAIVLLRHVGVDMENPAAGFQWARMAEALVQRSEASPAELAELHQARGVLQTQERHFEEAIPDLEQAVALWAKAVGPDRPQVGNARRDLGAALGRQGKYEQALAELRRAQALEEKALGPDHPDVAAIHGQIGLVFSDQAKAPEAMAELRQALAIDERVLGPEHSQVASDRNAIGRALWRMGQVDQAREEFKVALRIKEKALGPDHPEVAAILSNLGVMLWHSGHYDDALAAFHRALAIQEKTLGANHPETADVHNNLGMVLGEQGRHDAALAEYQIALSIDERTLGPDHAAVAKTLSNMGNSLTAEKRFDEALAAFQRALAIQEKTLGPEHPSTAVTLGNMGEIDRARHAWQAAQDHLGRAIDILAAHRPDPLLLGEFRFELAQAQWDAKQDRVKALALARQARDDYGQLPARQREQAEVEAWLKGHSAKAQ